jgi:hypothetical protein
MKVKEEYEDEMLIKLYKELHDINAQIRDVDFNLSLSNYNELSSNKEMGQAYYEIKKVIDMITNRLPDDFRKML